ncbi:MAG: AEC family transporter [Bacillota bacterium]|nr:AEC family transporter [Bacillota bacterium]
MSIFLHILEFNILPIFILIFLGYILSRKFDLNINTLSKLNFYIFVPSFIFVNLYTADLHMDMLKVFLCAALLLAVYNFTGTIVAKLRGYNASLANGFKNSIMFNNSGNIGLSLITLIFSSAPFVVNGKTPYLDTAISAQIMILALQNISTNTLGFYNLARANTSLKACMRKIFSMPTIYAVPLSLILRLVPFDLSTAPGWPAMVYIKNGLVPVALLTLGVQLAKTSFDWSNKEVYLSVFIRLIAGPVIAVLFIYIFGFTGVVAQTVLIAYSVPTAVNTALIAVECGSCQDFAAQAVMLSTLLSTFTLTFAIYAARIIFPV